MFAVTDYEAACVIACLFPPRKCWATGQHIALWISNCHPSSIIARHSTSKYITSGPIPLSITNITCLCDLFFRLWSCTFRQKGVLDLASGRFLLPGLLFRFCDGLPSNVTLATYFFSLSTGIGTGWLSTQKAKQDWLMVSRMVYASTMGLGSAFSFALGVTYTEIVLRLNSIVLIWDVLLC